MPGFNWIDGVPDEYVRDYVHFFGAAARSGVARELFFGGRSPAPSPASRRKKASAANLPAPLMFATIEEALQAAGYMAAEWDIYHGHYQNNRCRRGSAVNARILDLLDKTIASVDIARRSPAPVSGLFFGIGAPLWRDLKKPGNPIRRGQYGDAAKQKAARLLELLETATRPRGRAAKKLSLARAAL